MAETDSDLPPHMPFRQMRTTCFLVGAAAGVAATLAIGALIGDPDKTSASDRQTETIPKTSDRRNSSSSEDSYQNLSPRQASADLVDLLNTATALEDSRQFNVLVDKASKFNPQASFEAALGMSDPARRRDALRRVLGTWVLQDRGTALAAVDQIKNVALRGDLIKSAVASLSRNVPAAAVEVLRSRPSLRDDELWHEPFSNWTKADPDAALAAWRSLEHPEERGDALRGIAHALVRKDLPSAIEWAQQLTDKEDKEQAMFAVLRQASNSNPMSAAQHFASLKNLDSERARELAGRIAEEWAETDFPAAVAWTEALPAPHRDRALREIAGDLMRYDPDAAQEMALRIGDWEQRRRVVGELARLRMTASAEDTISWIADLPPRDQETAWRSAAYEWARTRPEEAAAFALSESLPESARRQLIETATPQWAQTDPASAAEWAMALSGNSGRGALARVVEVWSQRDPQAAIAFIANNADGKRLEELTRRAVSSWSQSNPAQAADYASRLEQSEHKGAVFRDVTERWMRSDPMAASEWVAALEPGPARDSAVDSLVYRIERDDLEAAFIWAETIADTRRRDEIVRRLLRRLGDQG